MEQEKLKLLIRRYISREADLAELEGHDSDSMKAALEAVLAETGAKESYDAQRFEPILKNILNSDKATPIRKLHPMRWAAAAAVILMISISGYFYFNNNKETLRQAQGDIVKNDIAPGKQGAILKLSNGKTIILDTAQNGKLLDNFTKTSESLTVESTEMSYATLTTPKARTQQLTLVDGSKVWLNSESSIHFPTVFTGTERNVEITGEVYFEIAHNAKMPFNVKVNGMRIEVLGTHFNVNSYDNEELIKTTLLEGSVRIRKNNIAALLKPGQQAQLNKQSELKVVNADVDEAVAWKNGYFSFKDADLKMIMRQISRWYDVEVIFEGSVPAVEFSGEIGRQLTLTQFLSVLSETRIHYKINGKRLIIVP